MAGNALSPMLRRKLHEETMMLSALLALTICGFVTTYVGGVTGGVILAATVNCSAAICRLAFESVVQSDAPDANRARAFAVFETQNQLAFYSLRPAFNRSFHRFKLLRARPGSVTGF